MNHLRVFEFNYHSRPGITRASGGLCVGDEVASGRHFDNRHDALGNERIPFGMINSYTMANESDIKQSRYGIRVGVTRKRAIPRSVHLSSGGVVDAHWNKETDVSSIVYNTATDIKICPP